MSKKLEITITGKDELSGPTKKAEQSLDEVGKAAEQTEGKFGGLWKQVALGQLAYATAMQAGRAFVGFLKDSIKAAQEQEQADKRMQAALEATGRPVAELTRSFKAFASEIQRTTTFSDTAVQSAVTLMVQMTDLDEKGIKAATKGAMGLATVFEMDLQSASNLVAKAMAGNTSALTRYGIQIDKNLSQEEQRGQILQQLSYFYGQVEADADTHAGKLKMIENAWGDVQKGVGSAINEAILPLLGDMQVWITDNEEAIKEFAIQAVESLKAVAGVVAAVVKAIIDIGKAIAWVSEKTQSLGAIVNPIHYRMQQLALEYGKAMKKAQEDTSEYEEALAGVDAASQKAVAAAEKIKRELAAQGSTVRRTDRELRNLTSQTEDYSAAVVLVKTQVVQVPPVLDAITGAIINDTLALRDNSAAWRKWSQEQSEAAAKAAENTREYGMTVAETFAEAFAAAGVAVNHLSSIIAQHYEAKWVLLENDYQKQLAAIENSTMSETEKEEAILALNQEYEAKRRALKYAEAKSEKAMSITKGTMAVAEAAAKALTAGPLIGQILSGIVAAMGAVLVARIAATPIPLAKGAIFNRPTVLQSAETGQQYQVAEAGEAEIISSPRRLREAIGLGSNGGGGGNINLTIPVYVAGHKVQTVLLRLVQDGSQTGRLKIAQKAVVAI